LVLPLQQVVYGQLLYLVTVESVITALLGTRQRWQPIRRAGIFAAHPRPRHHHKRPLRSDSTSRRACPASARSTDA